MCKSKIKIKTKKKPKIVCVPLRAFLFFLFWFWGSVSLPVEDALLQPTHLLIVLAHCAEPVGAVQPRRTRPAEADADEDDDVITIIAAPGLGTIEKGRRVIAKAHELLGAAAAGERGHLRAGAGTIKERGNGGGHCLKGKNY